MNAGLTALASAAIAAVAAFVVALALDKNIWLAAAMAGLVGVLVFFATRSYYSELSRAATPDQPGQARRVLPFTREWRTRRLVAAGRLEVAGQQLAAAGDWAGARRLLATEVSLREEREPLLRLLQASRSLVELEAALPRQTPPAFRALALDTANDVSGRLWAKAAVLARVSQATLPAPAEAELTLEARRINELAAQVEDAATDLLRLSLAGYDPAGVSQGTRLLTAVRHKTEVLLSAGQDDPG